MPKNFAPNEPIHFGESFLVSKGLFTKSPLVGVWGDAPTLNATTVRFPTPFHLRKVCQRTSHRMNPFIFAKVFADFQGAFYKKPLEAGFGATPQHSTRHNLRGACRDIQCSHCRKALREAVFQTVMTQKCSQRRGRAILPFLYKNEK